MAESEDHSEFVEFLGEDTAALAAQIPQEIRNPLMEKWKKLRQELDTARAANPNLERPASDAPLEDPIAQVSELESEVNSLKAQLSGKNEENENLKNQLEDMHSSYSQARQKSVALEESNDKLKSENSNLKRDKETFSKDVEEYREVSDRRRSEIEALHADCKRLTEQLSEANASKCEALIKFEEVESKDISLKHKEQRLEQERQLFEERLSALSEDLRHSHEQNSLTRRELTAKIAHLEGDLSHKNESIRILEGRQEALMADKEVLQSRIDDLIERLKEARDSKSSCEEGFRQEVRAKQRLADLYQKQAEDEVEKSEKLANAVDDLQRLLKESGDRYGALEDHYEKEKEEHKDEIKRRNDAIRVLRKELTDANELIKDLKHKGMTDEGIAALSPAAAAASKLIKSGMSLTSVYSQLVTCQEELLAAGDENRRLNTYLEQILNDIDQRAPLLKKQRDEYDRAVATVNQLTQQNEELKESNREDSEAVENLKRKLETMNRDNDRLFKQNKDLGQQVTVLLREVEAARFGRTTRHDTSGGASEVTDADGAISERLVSFRDVQELQTRNMELLTVVREVTAKQEASEAKLVEERTADLKKELDSVNEELDNLKEARRRQEALVENLVMQRDMFKSMAEGSKDTSLVTSTPTTSIRKSPQVQSQAEVRAAKAEAALEEIKKDFQVYREEKTTHEKMLDESLQRATLELSEARSKAIKLAANEEWNTERFKIAQNNNATYKKEIGFLEEKNSNLNALVGKHEQSIQVMHAELVQANTNVARLTNQFERTKQENVMLKNIQGRLEKERDILSRQTSGSAMIAENLKLVQLKLDQNESETRMRLQNQADDLTKEINLLRKKLEHEQESYHKSVKAWESAQLELRSKCDALKENETKALGQAEELGKELEDIKHQFKICQEKLALVQAQGSGSGSGMVDSERVVDLQSQVNALKIESVSLKEHLAKARQTTNQYKEIADAAEKQVLDSNEIYKTMQSKYDDLQRQSKETQSKLEQQIQGLDSQRQELERRATEEGQDVVNVQQLQVTIEGYKDQIKGSEERQRQMEMEIQQQLKQVKEVQDKYERELIAHASTTNTLKTMRDAIRDYDTKLSALEEAKNVAETKVKETTEDAKATESTLRAEYESLKQQFDVLEKENEKMHETMSNMTTQMASIQDTSMSAGQGDMSLNMSKSFSEEDAKSMEQLMEIIKYLRSEKAILTSKVEVSRTEAMRLKAQLESLQNQLAETQNALNVSQEKSHQSILPSSKYSQLLEQVQTIPALSDSNRYLREERDQLKLNLVETQKKLAENEAQITPLQEQIKELKETEDKTNAELVALKNDNTRWRNRVTQLIEKHQKISPEELMKAQNENSILKQKVAEQMNSLNGLAAKIKSLESNLQEKTNTLAKTGQDLLNAKTNQQQMLQKMKLLTQKNQENEGASKLLLSQKEALVQEVQQLRTELSNAAAKQTEISNQHQAIVQEAEKSKAEITTKDKIIESFKSTNGKLKTLGRNLQEKNKSLEAEKTALAESVKKLEETIANQPTQPAEAADTSSATEQSSEVEKLIEESALKIEELETKLSNFESEKVELTKKIEELTAEVDKANAKETRAKGVLVTAKEQLTKAKEEKQALAKKIEAMERQGGQGASSTTQAVEALETQLAEERTEKEKLKEAYEKLSQELQEQSHSTKPATVPASTVRAAKTGQPQAQVPPTRQAPAQVPPTRQASAPKQTATIQPTAMRTTPRPSNVASVSPSSAASLNPNASDFVPRTSTEQVEPSMVQSIEAPATSVAMVQPRSQSGDEPQPGPSTSSSMTASVAPTMKRTRDEDSEQDPAKKARTTETQEEDCVVLSSDEEESQVEEDDPEPENADELEEDDDSEGGDEYDEQEGQQVVVVMEAEDLPDDPAGEEEGEFEEETEVAGPGEQAEDQDDNEDVVEVGDSDDEDNNADYMEEALEDEGISPGQTEESGIVPQMGGDQASRSADDSGAPAESASSQQTVQYDDAIDDSVVPSTPKLSASDAGPSQSSFRFQPSTSAEGSPSASSFAALAAQASTSPGSSSGVKGASQEGIDRTSVDITQLARTATSTSTTSSEPSSSANTFAALAKLPPSTTIFGGASGSSGSSAFPPATTPVFGAPPKIAGRTIGSPVVTQSIFGSSTAVTTTVPASSSEAEPSGSQSTETQGQGIEVVESSRPRISRTPIVWSPPASGQTAEAVRGRGQVARGGAPRARRSRGRPGPRGGTS